jgi:hypothetical protein
MPLSHRHKYAAGFPHGLPTGDINQPRSSPRPLRARVRATTQPTSVRLELVALLRSFLPLVSHVHLLDSLAGPRPSDGPSPSRRCQGCCPPSPPSRGSGCPQLQPVRCDGLTAVSFHHRTVMQRLVALDVRDPKGVGSVRGEHAPDEVQRSDLHHASALGQPARRGAADPELAHAPARPRYARPGCCGRIQLGGHAVSAIDAAGRVVNVDDLAGQPDPP